MARTDTLLAPSTTPGRGAVASGDANLGVPRNYYEFLGFSANFVGIPLNFFGITTNS